MYKYFLIFAFLWLNIHLTAQDATVKFVRNYTKSNLEGLFFGVPVENGVDVYRVNYPTINPKGDSVIASGIIYVANGCGQLPLAIYQHGTVLYRNEVPSNGYEYISLLIASLGSVAISPDYLGLGDNIDIHPYLHAESEATTTIDLMRVTKSYLQDTLNVPLNGEVFITGYSQGGHAAMALHQYIEENNLLSEFNVVASLPLSGPYHLSGIQTRLPADSIYSVPVYLPYLVESMQYVYGNLYNNPSEYYQAPYDSLIVLYQNGLMEIGDIGNILPSNVFNFMQPNMLNAFNADTIQPYKHPFRIALSLNDNYNWTPIRPVKMVYCTADEQVFYQNTLIAEDSMNANGATDVISYLALAGGTHGTCFLPALNYAYTYFLNKKTPCVKFNVNTEEVFNNKLIEIAPNPSAGLVNVVFKNSDNFLNVKCSVYNLSGQIVFEKTIKNTNQFNLDLSELPSGMYVLVGNIASTKFYKKIVIVK